MSLGESLAGSQAYHPIPARLLARLFAPKSLAKSLGSYYMYDARRYSLRNSFLFTRVAEGLRIFKTEDSFPIYLNSTLRNRHAQIYRSSHAICMWNEKFNSKTDSWSWQPRFAHSSTVRQKNDPFFVCFYKANIFYLWTNFSVAHIVCRTIVNNNRMLKTFCSYLLLYYCLLFAKLFMTFFILKFFF